MGMALGPGVGVWVFLAGSGRVLGCLYAAERKCSFAANA